MPENTSKFTANFAADLYTEGSITVPVALLRNYKRLNISEMELVLLLHLITKIQLSKDSFPSCEELANYMTIDSLTIKAVIASLIEKGILVVDRKFDIVSGDWINYYSLHGLFLKLADLWVLETKDEKKHSQKQKPIEKEILGQLYKSFEREFGRLLSPMEISQIAEWYKGDKHSPELIYEALKRAVLRNVLNFKYVDSILRDWARNNIKTVKQAEMHDEKFQGDKSPGRTSKGKVTGKKIIEKEKDKYKNLYLS